MLFALSKAAGAALAPATLLWVLLALALWWQRRRPATSRLLLGLAFAALAALSLCPLAHWIAGPLERRFPERPLPPEVDGIVILGGGIETAPGDGAGHISLNSAAARITEAVALARRFPKARLLYSGGSGAVFRAGEREADLARPLFESMGVAADRMIYERDSRNTWENAVYSKHVAQPQAGQVWLLVTSAFHMPRAMGCFRQAGWSVLPYPVDFIGASSQWGRFDADRELFRVSLAQKEWIGLIAYHLLGRTDAWFPGPRPR